MVVSGEVGDVPYGRPVQGGPAFVIGGVASNLQFLNRSKQLLTFWVLVRYSHTFRLDVRYSVIDGIEARVLYVQGSTAVSQAWMRHGQANAQGNVRGAYAISASV